MDGADRPPEEPPVELNVEVNRRIIMALGDTLMRSIVAEAQRDIALADLKKLESVKQFK